MLTIRLSRTGKRNKPMYRLVISEKARDPQSRALEILGSYNPHTKDLNIKEDRVRHWIEKGSGLSPSVNNLLIDKGVIEGEKVTASKSGKKKGEEAPKEEVSGADKEKTGAKEESVSEEEVKKEEAVEAEEEKKDEGNEEKSNNQNEESKE